MVESVFLTYTGGSGDSFRWYTDGCGTSLVGFDDNLEVFPTATTTYFGRWENACGASTCETVVVNITATTVAPTSVDATELSICNGNSTTLSYTGGSGTIFKWYTVDCGDTEVGTGNDLDVSPTVTTTYYGRWETDCEVTTCETITITVNDVPTAPTSVDADVLDICAGDNVELTYTDGLGDTFVWYTIGCGDTQIGTGNNLIVNPTETTTYYGRWENSCGVSVCETVTINANPIPDVPVASFDCSVTGGLSVLTVTEPLGASYLYSVDGITFQADPVFADLPDGDYTVTVDLDGCTNTSDLITVDCICEDPALLTMSVTSGAACSNEVFTLSGNTFGGATTEVTVTHDGAGVLDE
ncbi:MAG: hypothetical protein C0596_14505 [Marinilabiliales bacterium]|nr:MAG: hypothetical protein C0596_14505 [Marinilabiliales bacterium]